MRIFFRGFVLFFFFLLAQSVSAVEVKPPILEVSAVPGATTSTVFILKNTETREQTYAFTIQGFVVGGEKGEQRFLPMSETAGLPSWLFLTTPRVTLQAGEEVGVPLFFRPSLEAKAGGYQAVVFATAIDPQTTGVVLGSRVGVLIFAEVKGEVHREVLVKDFIRTSPKIVDQSFASFDVVVENRGDIHEIPAGDVVLMNMFGRVVTTLPLQGIGRPARVLPHSERRFSVTWGKEPVNLGFGRGLQEEWSRFYFGIYHARLEMKNMAQPSQAEIEFFVLPWRTAIVGIGVIVLILMLGFRRGRG